jgi:hypothetical protein
MPVTHLPQIQFIANPSRPNEPRKSIMSCTCGATQKDPTHYESSRQWWRRHMGRQYVR